MKKKVGVVGYGGMGQWHVCSIQGVTYCNAIPFNESDVCEVVAIYDIDPAKNEKARKDGYKTYDTLEEFLADESIEIVVIATPNDVHEPIAIAAMEAGKHVISEKPVTLSCESLERMIAASERTGKKFSVHQNRRYDDYFLGMKKIKEEGAIGDIISIESRVHGDHGIPGDWRKTVEKGGGMLYDWGVHMLDQICWLIKEPIKSVSANVFPLWSEEVDDYSKVIITFESGLVAHMEVVTYSPIPLPRWMVYGDRGAMTMQDMGDPTVKVRRIKKDENKVIDVPAFIDHKVITRKQKRHFIEEFEELEVSDVGAGGDWGSVYKNIAGVLAGTEELIVKPCEVMRTFKVIEAAFKSAAEGKTVQF